MGLFRVILLGIIVWLVISMLKRLKLNREGKKAQVTSQEKVVQCKTCGVYVPENEAFRVGDTAYCSREHQLADSPDQDQE